MIALAQDATQKNCPCSMKAMFLYPYSIALTTQEHCSYNTRTLLLQHKNIVLTTRKDIQVF